MKGFVGNFARSFASIGMAVIGLSTSTSFGWGDMGHELIGEIAYSTMDQKTRDMVRGVLGVEPMTVAATWPDAVRDDARFGTRSEPGKPETELHDFSPFHFCEVPVGYNYANRPRKIEKDCNATVNGALTLIASKGASREAKMIALRYLIHVVGDIHQPLHVGNGFDRGANACQIKWKATPTSSERSFNFHSFWDTEMVDVYRRTLSNAAGKPPLYTGDVMKVLKKDKATFFKAAAKKKYGAGKLMDWIEESAGMREELYPDDAAQMAGAKKGEEYKSRPYCVWYEDQTVDKNPAPGSVIDPAKIPVLGEDYANKFTDKVELQIFKAGLRLATMLDGLAKKAKDITPLDDASEEAILKEIQAEFHN